jgi:hypothetical protein
MQVTTELRVGNELIETSLVLADENS